MGSHFSGSSDPSPETPETRLPSCFSKSRPVLSKVQAVTIRSSFKFKDKLKKKPKNPPTQQEHFGKKRDASNKIQDIETFRGRIQTEAKGGHIHQFRGHEPNQSAVETLICSLYFIISPT